MKPSKTKIAEAHRDLAREIWNKLFQTEAVQPGVGLLAGPVRNSSLEMAIADAEQRGREAGIREAADVMSRPGYDDRCERERENILALLEETEHETE